MEVVVNDPVSQAMLSQHRLDLPVVHTNLEPAKCVCLPALGGAAPDTKPQPPSFTGAVCAQCGSSHMRPTGTCLTCMECGSSGGCG